MISWKMKRICRERFVKQEKRELLVKFQSNIARPVTKNRMMEEGDEEGHATVEWNIENQLDRKE